MLHPDKSLDAGDSVPHTIINWIYSVKFVFCGIQPTIIIARHLAAFKMTELLPSWGHQNGAQRSFFFCELLGVFLLFGEDGFGSQEPDDGEELAGHSLCRLRISMGIGGHIHRQGQVRAEGHFPFHSSKMT